MSESVTEAPEEVTEDALEEKRAMLAELRAGIAAAEATVAEAQAAAARKIESDQLDRELELQARRLKDARDAAVAAGVSQEALESAVDKRLEASKQQAEAVEKQREEQAAADAPAEEPVAPKPPEEPATADSNESNKTVTPSVASTKKKG